MSWTPEKAARAELLLGVLRPVGGVLTSMLSDALAEIDRLTKALDTEWGRGWDEAMAEVEVTKVRKR